MDTTPELSSCQPVDDSLALVGPWLRVFEEVLGCAGVELRAVATVRVDGPCYERVDADRLDALVVVGLAPEGSCAVAVEDGADA